MSDVADWLSFAKQPDLSQIAQSVFTALTSVTRALLLWLTVGVAGAVLFTTTYLIEGATRPGYNGWQQAISALSLGPGGWLQQADFIVFRCVHTLYGCRLAGGTQRRRRRPVVSHHSRSRRARVDSRWLLLTGPSTWLSPRGTRLTPSTLHEEIHIIGAFVNVFAMVLGLFVMAWRFARDLHWRGWAVYSMISGILTLVFMALFGMVQRVCLTL